MKTPRLAAQTTRGAADASGRRSEVGSGSPWKESSCGGGCTSLPSPAGTSRCMKEAFEEERCLDPQLFHVRTGSMVQMPPARSRVYYTQGHEEHAHAGGATNLAAGARPLPPLVLCSVTGVRFLTDPEIDEVFAKIRLAPLAPGEVEFCREPHEFSPADAQEKLSSFAKTLTQSDANNGGV